MMAMQLDVLERVAVDELAMTVVGAASVGPAVVPNGTAAGDVSALQCLVELGLITDGDGLSGGGRVRITPAGVEALAYLAAVA